LFFSLFPLFFNLPYRIHLDLPYEGAYRMYIGQMPFRDFGIPFGYGFFIIPTAFFHLFGPHLSSLLYAQTFLNMVSCLAFLSILTSLHCRRAVVFLSVLVYCLGYVFIYFWPWHTHTAYTYGLVALAFLLQLREDTSRSKTLILTTFAAFFSFLSLFTKQDYGGLNLAFCTTLLSFQAYYTRKWWPMASFAVAYLAIGLAFVVPLLKYDFGYWFNHGQAPHTARLHKNDFLNELFMGADWEKFYLLLIACMVIWQLSEKKLRLKDKSSMLLLLMCLGMIVEAIITKVTSRMSTGTTTYFHAFTVAYLVHSLGDKLKLHLFSHLLPIIVLIVLWWSPMYWKYASRMFDSGHSHIPRKTKESTQQKGWEMSKFKSLQKVKMPSATIEGIARLKKINVFEKTEKLNVMNMTELTMLPYELGYVPLKKVPLWYDLGVAIFPKQVAEICGKIGKKEYDLFLFEVVPSLDNFYPEEVRTCLQKHYQLTDIFLAPRKEEDSIIEVYTRK
jgi:hypothetical protein